MRLTILSVLLLAYTVQVFSLPLQSSSHQSDGTPSLAVSQVTSTSHQNDEQQENSAKASADRIRKIVEAALSSRRATTPSPSHKIKPNHQETVVHEKSETSNKNKDIISESNKSLTPTPRTVPKIQPIKTSSSHAIQKSSDSKSPVTISRKNIPSIPEKTKISSSHAIQKSSDSKSPVTISRKNIPSIPEKTKIPTIKNRNVNSKTKTSNLSSTSDNMSLPIFHITPTMEELDTKSKFISPWEKKTDEERKTQLEAILKLVGRHVLTFDSEESLETFENVRNYKYTPVIMTTNDNQHSNFKSLRIDESKQMIIESEENMNRPKTISENNDNVGFSTISEVQKPSMVDVDIKEPVHVTDNSQIVDMMQLTEVDDEVKKMILFLEENINRIESITEMNDNVKLQLPEVDDEVKKMIIFLEENINKIESITEMNDNVKLQLPEVDDEVKKIIIFLEENINRIESIREMNDNVKFSTINEMQKPSMVDVDTLEPVPEPEHSPIADKFQLTEADEPSADEVKQLITFLEENVNKIKSIPENNDNVKFSTISEMQKPSMVDIDIKDPVPEPNHSQIVDMMQLTEANDPSFDQNKRHHESVISSTDDFFEFGTLKNVVNIPKPKQKDLSTMIVDLLFKVTGYGEER